MSIGQRPSPYDIYATQLGVNLVGLLITVAGWAAVGIPTLYRAAERPDFGPNIVLLPTTFLAMDLIWRCLTRRRRRRPRFSWAQGVSGQQLWWCSPAYGGSFFYVPMWIWGVLGLIFAAWALLGS